MIIGIPYLIEARVKVMISIPLASTIDSISLIIFSSSDFETVKIDILLKELNKSLVFFDPKKSDK